MKRFMGYCMTAFALWFMVPGIPAAQSAQSGETANEHVRKQSVQEEQKTQSMKAVQRERKNAEQLREPIIGSAQEGMGEVITAVALLDQGREKAALTHLQKAEGKLDTAIAANPGLMFATVDSQVRMFTTLETNNDIKKELAFIEDLLEEGRVQEARSEMSTLREEIVVTTTSLPLATYPHAIKQAVAELADGKTDEAYATLQASMNTLMVTNTVFPVPVLMAKDAVERASKMDKTKKEQVRDTLDFAQQQLKKAELLGYLKDESSRYEHIEEKIAMLKDEVKEKNQIEKLYSELKKDLQHMWNNITG